MISQPSLRCLQPTQPRSSARKAFVSQNLDMVSRMRFQLTVKSVYLFALDQAPQTSVTESPSVPQVKYRSPLLIIKGGIPVTLTNGQALAPPSVINVCDSMFFVIVNIFLYCIPLCGTLPLYIFTVSYLFSIATLLSHFTHIVHHSH